MNADEYVRRFDAIVLGRSNWEGHWEEIAQRIVVDYSGSFANQQTTRSQGEKRTQLMLDPTGALALDKFTSVMESLNTPRNSKWHALVPSDPLLLRNRAARQWFDDARDVLFKRRYAPTANFQGQQQIAYMSYGAFGTGPLFIDKNELRGGLRYKCLHLGEVFFLENHQGTIDTMYRKFPLKARQAIKQFGETGRLPQKILEAAKDEKKFNDDFWFLHCVHPRTEEDGYDPGRLDYRGMEYVSIYVQYDEKVILREGGYNTFPVPVSRYKQAPGEIYGRSPAMLALPSIKTLNEQKKTLLKQGHRAVDPVILAHDDGVVDAFSLKPGAVNSGAVNKEGRPLVHALPVGRVDIGKDMMDQERFVINDAFMINLFQILIETPTMTATEVLERAREKGMLIAPTMGRLQAEYFGPMIERELDVLSEQNLLPPMPSILLDAQGEYDVEYNNPMSRAARAEEAAGLFRTIDWLKEYVAITGDRRPLDHVNFDSAMPDVLDINGVPVRWVGTADYVARERSARDQQAATATAIEAAPAAAGVAKAMGNAAK